MTDRWGLVRSVIVAAVLTAALAQGGAAEVVRAGQPAPELAQGAWINSAPLTVQGLRGRVVLVEFWTYG